MKKDVAAKYDVAEGYMTKADYPGFGVVDLSELTLEAADILYEAGFCGLVLKKATAKKDKTTE